jgi:Zn-dependent protease
VSTVPLSLAIHEFAHAQAADWMGDETPRRFGRLTLNPLAHLDPIGLLMIFFGPIGWAKPVPLQPHRFRNPRLGLFLTALAGPVSNLLLGCLCLCVLRLFAASWAGGAAGFLYNLVTTGAIINVSLFAFNLIPVPPLDGWRILSSVLPLRWGVMSGQYDLYGSFLLLLIVLIPALRDAVLGRFVGGVLATVAGWFGFQLGW